MAIEILRLHTSPRMSQVVIANGVVYLAGQVPHTPNVSVTEQTTQVLGQIDALLQEVGVDRTHLLTANIWLSDPRHFADFNAVWDAWLSVGEAPTRACVQALLMKPGCDVEVAVTALLA